jgi:WD40 repeat protein
MFFTSSYDGHVHVFDSSALESVAKFRLSKHVYSLGCSKLPQRSPIVAAATDEGDVRLLDVVSGSSVHALAGHRRAVMAVRWSPLHEHILASCSIDKTIRVWDIRGGATRSCVYQCVLPVDEQQQHGRSLPLSSSSSSSSPTSTPTPSSRKRDRMQQSLEITRAVLARDQPSDVVSGCKSMAHEGAVMHVEWTPDGQWLLSTGKDGMARKWRASDGRFESAARANHMSGASSQFAIGADGDVMFAPVNRDIVMLSIGAGPMRYRRTLSGHLAQANACAVHPLYGDVYSVGNDRNVLLWSADALLDARVTPSDSVDQWSDDDNSAIVAIDDD